MNILVTGGCGFIGSHFIAMTLRNDKNARVVNLDALTYAAHPATKKMLDGLDPHRYRFVHGSILGDAVHQLCREENFSAIVNFAAETHVDRSILDPDSFVATNIIGAQNIANAARANGNIRFVHVSTDEVYGSLAADAPQSVETDALDPNSPYAASKASADLLLLAAARTYRQPILITRCTNNYGPYQFPEKLLPLLIANSLEDKPLPVYGDGKQVRDWIYVEDHCSGIDLVMRNGRPGEVYNISASSERHNIEMVHQILNLLGKPESLIRYVGDRPAHDRRYGLCADKIRKELGWSPTYGLEAGLKRTVEWYIENQSWWRQVRDKDYYQYYQKNYETKFETTVGGSV